MSHPTERGCAFCWPLTPRGRIVLGPRIGICEGCAGDIQEALRSPPASAAQIPGHRPVPNANGRHTAFYAGRGVSVAGIQPVPLGIPGFLMEFMGFTYLTLDRLGSFVAGTAGKRLTYKAYIQ